MMIKKNKNSFSLIEVIGTLVILTLIVLLVVLTIIGIINRSRNEITMEQLSAVEKSARIWLANNLSWIDDKRDICISVASLINEGYIEKSEIKNPTTNKPMNGYIVIEYKTQKKHGYTYNEKCNVEMAKLKLEVPSNTFNSQRWANKNIEVKVIGDKNTTKYKYCQSTTGPCTPDLEQSSSSGEVIIKTEGINNYVCATAIQNGNELSRECTGTMKLDHTAPILNIPGNAAITNKVFNFNFMDGVTATDNMSSDSALKVEAIGNVSFGIAGDYIITYRATDEAGNVTTKTRKIKIKVTDGGMPSLIMSLDGNPLNARGWSKTNVNININVQNQKNGIKNFKYCVSSTGICEPNIVVNGRIGTATITTEGVTNYLCANAENNNGVVNDTVCMGPYKIDKTTPTLNIPKDLIISYRETEVDLRAGVTYSDNLTSHNELTYQIIGGLSFGIFGEYPITYRVTDLAGNSTTKIRNIIVTDDEKPQIKLKIESATFNPNEWTNRNIIVSASADDGDGIGVKNYTYCTSVSPTCTPDTTVNAVAGNFAISIESATNYACAVATDISNNVSERVCIGPYKIDKTPPILTVSGPLLVTHQDKTIDLIDGINITDNLTATGAINMSINGSVSIGMLGDYFITYHVTDLAGNTTSQTRKVTIGDNTPPTIAINVSGEFNVNNYAKGKITATIVTDDSNGVGVKNYTYCITTFASCIPNIKVAGIKGTFTFGVDSKTNYICGVATDRSNNTSPKLCKGPYQIDTTPPILNVPSYTEIGITSPTFNVNEGVTYSDNTTSKAGLNYTSSGNVSLGMLGEYLLTYKVTDLAGNITEKTREIKIYNDLPPVVTLTVVGNPFDANNWAKSNFNINVSTNSQFGKVTSYKYCTSESVNCTPNVGVESNSGAITISTNSSTNYVCAVAIDDTGMLSEKVCAGPYRLDKIVPTCNIELSESSGSNSWYIGDVTVSLSRKDSISGISKFGLTTNSSIEYNNKASIVHNSNTTGITYYGYVTDLAGNTNSCNVTFKRDASIPSISLSNNGLFNSNGWAKANFTVTAKGMSGAPGVNSIIHCTSSTGPCTPNQITSGSNSTITVSAESSTNYVCAYTVDNAGRVSGTSCSGPHKLDKTAPSVSHSESISFNTNTSFYDLWSGVSHTDNTSGICNENISGNVTLGTAGIYNATYKVTDCAGNAVSKNRKFTVMPVVLPGGSGGSDGTFINSTGHNYVFTNKIGSTPRYTYNIVWDSATKNGDTFTINNLKVTYSYNGNAYSLNSSRTDAGGCGSCTNFGGGMLSTSNGTTQMPSVLNNDFGKQSCNSRSNTVQVCIRWQSGNLDASSNTANLTKTFNFEQ